MQSSRPNDLLIGFRIWSGSCCKTCPNGNNGRIYGNIHPVISQKNIYKPSSDKKGDALQSITNMLKDVITDIFANVLANVLKT